ncbi:MAG: hypothetical protein ACFFG0_16545 [Candidatus Thorarchaeota archaeon]
MINLSYWELILGLITIVSFAFNIFQYYKVRVIQNHAVGIYSQLWDIIVEIDKKSVTDIPIVKRLINQVRIEVIALNRSLKSKETIINPWSFAEEEKKESYRKSIEWIKEKMEIEDQIQKTEDNSK